MEDLLPIHCSLLKIERRFLIPRNDNPPWSVMPGKGNGYEMHPMPFALANGKDENKKSE
jgi:hypothetical protein